MQPENSAQQEPSVTEPVPAPEIFTDGYVSVGLGAGVAKFAFISMTHTSPEVPPERRVVLRLLMPLGAVVGVHEAMGKLIEGLKASGKIMEQAEIGAQK